LDKLKARSKKPAVIAVHRSPAPLNSSTHFPQLSTQQVPASSSSSLSQTQSVSFARTLSESNNNNHNNNAFKKLSLAQAKLNALPNINETIDIFVKMVDELSTCNDQKGQLAILLQYSTSFSFPNNDS
jgi:hypothetical protein